jgi:chromosome partitioning related protein ParA
VNVTTISVTGTKGGVGKTTICANLGAILAGFGYKVLLIDADVQPSLSGYFGLRYRSPLGLHSCISRGGVLDQECISQTTIENLDIVVSDEREVCAKGGIPLQAFLAEQADCLFIMRRAMRCPSVQKYNFVIIDTQGAVGDLQRTAAMAADIILATIKPDVLSATEFETGTRAMIEKLSVMKDFSSQLVPGKVYALINGANNTTNARAIADYIREQHRTSSTLQMLVMTVPDATAFLTCPQLPYHSKFQKSKVCKIN